MRRFAAVNLTPIVFELHYILPLVILSYPVSVSVSTVHAALLCLCVEMIKTLIRLIPGDMTFKMGYRYGCVLNVVKVRERGTIANYC